MQKTTIAHHQMTDAKPVREQQQLTILLLSRHHKVWDIPLVIWGQLSRLRPLPASRVRPAYSLAGLCEKQKRP